ncbi:CPA1 family monovalent cation:H+ antiporter [Actinoplanes campanulatus]|uniref:CPA1 family monovalent cation:H+ antiporter n=1 Tax=Actinoplanes campanulatus TaxID=113559 RepID=A0A7W5ASA2_9ACTN|nr:Na+/H+ antiporter [Actinoplanes campanulatus]MBB3100924.1 CPA1 family monovalent cation:H+ antiporter [Actinoplanes campanulatus]GGN46726.1 Na+/H+ antiporter [Actinoplanes campanulatus]GID41480.1 Na+/H+ antiporter [Actinoplanes campanulatus]
MSYEGILLFVLGAVCVIVAVRWVTEKTGLPAAVLLTLIGILYAYLPGPNLDLDPELVLTFILPPLLYNAALDSSLLDIRHNMRTVISLSVVLVLVTALLIGLGFSLWVAGATLAAGVALGATVAPPDPVAALAVGRKAGLPGKLVTLIQGEGLLNDATALTILTVAVAAWRDGNFNFDNAVGQFVISASGGVLVGVAVAYAVRMLKALRYDPLNANALSLITPLAAYLICENSFVHHYVTISGVLAVVVAGLIVGHDTPRYTTGASRLQVSAVWRLIDFLLEGMVFLLIGQQVPHVVRGLAEYETSTILIALAITLGVVLLLRPLWLVTTQWLPRSLHTRLGGQDEPETDVEKREAPLTGKEVVALSWAGTRGVITLAAVFTLPIGFPDRELLRFCAIAVVLVTLVGQGLTFAPLMRWLGLRANQTDKAKLRNEARSAAVIVALDRLDDIQEQQHDNVEDEAIETMRTQLQFRLDRYQRRLDLLEQVESHEVPESPQYEAALMVRQAVIDAEREELLRWRDAGRLDDDNLRMLNRELDHEELILPKRPSGS